ncbi:MAG: hypothetical protein M3346_09785, partial [Actinomycetota bacterium]|nr:hypothetical protein [Actinomycetota bacterium]
TKAIILDSNGRSEECGALMRHALAIALTNDVASAAERAYYNLSNLAYYNEDFGEALRYAQDGLALCRRLGEREWEWEFLASTVSVFYWTGRWDEALEMASDIPALEEIPAARFSSVELLMSLPPLLIAQGRGKEARALLASFEGFSESADQQERGSYEAAHMIVLRAEGKLAEARGLAETVIEREVALGPRFPGLKAALVEGAEVALARGDWGRAEELIGRMKQRPVGGSTPYLDAQGARLQALLDASRDEGPRVEALFKDAVGRFREIESPFWLGVCLLDYGEWLGKRVGPDAAEPLAEEAAEIFKRLGARPWLERAGRSAGDAAPRLAPAIPAGD